MNVTRAAGRWIAQLRLGTRLAAGTAALLLAVLAVVATSYDERVAERRAAEVENVVAVGRTFAAVVDGFRRDLESTSLAAALALGTTGEPLAAPATVSYLRTLFAQYGVLRSLFLTDVDGRVIATATGTSVGLDLSSRPYVRALRAGADAVWTSAPGIETGEITVAFGRPVKAPDGTVRAYLIAAFHPERVLDRLDVVLPADADLTLIDEVGVVMYSSAPDGANGSVADAPGVAAALRGSVSRVASAQTPFAGPLRFGAFVPVPGAPWVVGVTRPQGPLEAQLRAQALREAAGISVALGIAAVAGAALARRLMRPLTLLASAAGAVARGEQPQWPAEAREADPDVAQLATALEVMSAAVADREAELHRQAARLEVQARASQAFAEVALDLEAVLGAITRQVAGAIGDGCIVFLVPEEGPWLIDAAMHHPDPDAVALARSLLAASPTRIGEGVAGVVAQNGTPALVPVVDPAKFRASLRPELVPYLDRFPLHSLVAVPLRVQGRILGVLAAWRDTTAVSFTADDQRFLQDLADRAAQAVEAANLYRQAQRAIKVRDEFLSVAAHELKTPLTSVLGVTQVLIRRAGRGDITDAATLSRLLLPIEQQTRRLAKLVAQLLDISRIDAGKLALDREEVDLVEVVRGAVVAAQVVLGDRRIVVTAPDRPLVAAADSLRLEQVLTNLLDNAAKYSPPDAAIDVTLERLPADEVRVAVRDRGTGVPPEHRQRIFDRFYQAHGSGYLSGMGLGLYISRQIVELHGGRLEVEFPADGGTRMAMVLPALPLQAAAVAGDGGECDVRPPEAATPA